VNPPLCRAHPCSLAMAREAWPGWRVNRERGRDRKGTGAGTTMNIASRKGEDGDSPHRR